MAERGSDSNLPVLEHRAATDPVVVQPGDPRALIELQEHLVDRAVRAKASDLHIEPRADRVRVRLRIDGWLHDLEPLPTWLHPGLATRFKVISDMDIAEKRLPQDGRASVSGSRPRIDLRVSTLPTRHGEKIVVRLLEQNRTPFELDRLGLDEAGVRLLRGFMQQPQGMILAAGPTGAGKTTTLYSLLQNVDSTSRHVVTLEEPIEYTLPDVVQVPVQRRVGLDFAAALRAVLRQDPDVILLGEIRDEETARNAVRASVTGHLVLSTVHTIGAVESVDRLSDLGVPGYLLASSLIGVISQRLVRRLCCRCRAPYEPPDGVLAALGLPPPTTSQSYWHGKGCSSCRDGFDGRIGLFEILTVDPPLRRKLARGRPAARLVRAAFASGALRALGEAARLAVRAGATSPEEAARAVRSPRGADGLR